MKFINKERLENFLWGPKSAPFSLRKQLARIITFCCVLAVCIQAAVMVTMMLWQYVEQEKEDSLYILENDNQKLDAAFQYVEDLALSIRHCNGLRDFFNGDFQDIDSVEKELKESINLFGERNRLESQEVFVERVYLFNYDGDSVGHLYYPTTMSEMEKEQKEYEKIIEVFSESRSDFYCQVEEEYINLCIWLYDEEMKPLGGCIFALNKSGIESNYKNLEKFGHYSWSIYQGEDLIFGKDAGLGSGQGSVLENRFNTGFDLTLYAGIPAWVVYQFLGNMIIVLLLISTTLILLLSFCGHKMAVYYVKPLETIAEKIALVGKGNFETKLSGYRAQELQEISSTFNDMTDYIDHLVKEVYETQLIAQQAQIQYLQAQMNPHFLFNVLSMIETRAALNGDGEVQQMIHQLSKLYQGKIFRKDEYFIFLKEEMEIVEFYLSLQAGRFGEKISYSVVYEGIEENYERLLVPRLSIEPIVENAVCYGLLPKAEKGSVDIRVFASEEVLKIYIEDDGAGFDPNSVVEKAEDKNHMHVGLWNTNKMIHNLCGEEYGLKIESEIGKGTTVCVTLPVKYGEKNVESNGC